MEIHTVAHFMEDAEAIMMAGNCAVIFVEQLMSSKIKDIEALNGFLVRQNAAVAGAIVFDSVS